MTTTLTELDQRENNGITVSLMWNRSTNDVVAHVHDGVLDETFDLSIGGKEALDVFRHPYAYASTRPHHRRRPGSLCDGHDTCNVGAADDGSSAPS
jgi:hypothetical protein